MSGAVFLIVAGVLLGPIEPQQKADNWEAVAACARGHGIDPTKPMRKIPDDCPKVVTHQESAAESCERALREIGAVRGAWITLPVQVGGYRRFDPSDGGTQFAKDGTQVFCLPAPSGLEVSR